jgi:hypothetical protein
VAVSSPQTTHDILSRHSGAYRVDDQDDNIIINAWNVEQLRSFYNSTLELCFFVYTYHEWLYFPKSIPLNTIGHKIPCMLLLQTFQVTAYRGLSRPTTWLDILWHNLTCDVTQCPAIWLRVPWHNSTHGVIQCPAAWLGFPWHNSNYDIYRHVVLLNSISQHHGVTWCPMPSFFWQQYVVPCRDGSASGMMRVEHLSACEHTHELNSYSYPQCLSGRIPYPCQRPMSTRRVSGTRGVKQYNTPMI